MVISNIPPELWSHIFHFLSTVDEVTDSSSDAWANIVTANAKYTHVPSRSVIECNKAKCAVGLVCKDFYELSRPVVLETIRLTDTSLPYLARQIRERPEIARVVERSTKRIDLRSTERAWHREHEPTIIDLKIDLEIILKSSRNLTCLLYQRRSITGLATSLTSFRRRARSKRYYITPRPRLWNVSNRPS
ncbi:hypothetical protein ACEPAI_4079 [Sanghuangporus weigelae]